MKLFSKKASTLTIAALMLSSLAIPYASAEPGKSNGNKQNAPAIEVRTKNILVQGEKKFKDLNNNGRLDPYENWQVPTDVRVKDLVKKMTLEEKAGMNY
ncbi:hypothetical protein [Bacillus sp. ISL-77]|uniref:hypothetical protein n=1 Tax=Bacillus sp. ISL-77 TaxID=2819138 RepID=UPI001BE87528|nr:hypothetical protein [Bacillus sp. ISL-77]MBT2740604.1 hypothetical protein [Bacillus sp. ISL-77]